MPIHPVECVPCRHNFEVLTFSIHAEVDTTCPKCGRKAERRFGVPVIKTEATFFRAAQFGGAPFAGDPDVEKAYTGPARRAGVSIQGKVYQHQLARFPGDPEAYVGSKSEAREVLRRRGWGSKELGVKAREEAPPEAAAIGEDIVDRLIDQRIRAGTMVPEDRYSAEKRFEVGDAAAPHYKKGKYKPKVPKRPKLKK